MKLYLITSRITAGLLGAGHLLASVWFFFDHSIMFFFPAVTLLSYSFFLKRMIRYAAISTVASLLSLWAIGLEISKTYRQNDSAEVTMLFTLEGLLLVFFLTVVVKDKLWRSDSA
jgi:hypothetical protein